MPPADRANAAGDTLHALRLLASAGMSTDEGLRRAASWVAVPDCGADVTAAFLSALAVRAQLRPALLLDVTGASRLEDVAAACALRLIDDMEDGFGFAGRTCSRHGAACGNVELGVEVVRGLSAARSIAGLVSRTGPAWSGPCIDALVVAEEEIRWLLTAALRHAQPCSATATALAMPGISPRTARTALRTLAPLVSSDGLLCAPDADLVWFTDTAAGARAASLLGDEEMHTALAAALWRRSSAGFCRKWAPSGSFEQAPCPVTVAITYVAKRTGQWTS